MRRQLESAEVPAEDTPGGRVEVRNGNQQLTTALQELPGLADCLEWIADVLEDMAKPHDVEAGFGQAGGRDVRCDDDFDSVTLQGRTAAGVHLGSIEHGEPEGLQGAQCRTIATTDVEHARIRAGRGESIQVTEQQAASQQPRERARDPDSGGLDLEKEITRGVVSVIIVRIVTGQCITLRLVLYFHQTAALTPEQRVDLFVDVVIVVPMREHLAARRPGPAKSAVKPALHWPDARVRPKPSPPALACCTARRGSMEKLTSCRT